MSHVWLALGVPAAIWALSYAHLALYYRTADLFKIRIHESGRYTLAGTVFYFNHVLRELPIDSLYALSLAWSIQTLAPQGPAALTGAQAPVAAKLALLAVFLAFLAFGSIRRVGLHGSLLDLAQYRELDTVVRWGSHWQMHALSTLTLMLAFTLPGALAVDRLADLPWPLFLAFLALCVLFQTGRKALTDRRWVLHGAREVATYGALVGLPALLIVTPELAAHLHDPSAIPLVIGLVIAALLGYFGWCYRTSDLAALAQRNLGPAYLLTSHSFEHVLDVAFIGLLLFVLLGIPG